MSNARDPPMEAVLSSFRFPRPALPTLSGGRSGGASSAGTEFAKCFATVDMVDGVLPRRVIAYAIDFVLLTAIGAALWIVTLLSLGFLAPITTLLLAILPFAYHTLLVGGPDSSTVGMSLMGLEVRRWDGGRPGVPQALVMTVLFYVSMVPPLFLLLGYSFFNSLGRTVHDLFSGTVVVNRQEDPDAGPGKGFD